MTDTLSQIASFIPLGNLVVSVGMAVLGLFLYWKRRPALFETHTFMRWAFWCLFLRWMLLVGVWAVVVFPGEHQGWFMGAIDLQGVCDIGFAWIFIQGDEFSHRKTLESLVVLCIFLWVWNVAFKPPNAPVFGPGNTPNVTVLAARANWTAASEALSAFTVPLVGFAFLLRYRIFEALVLFIFSLGYAVLQRPVYVSTLLQSTTISQGIPQVPAYLLGLLIGKLVIGGMIYGFFFAPVEKYSVVTSQLSRQTVKALREGLWKSTRLTGHVGLALLLAIVADVIEKKYHLTEWLFVRHR